MPDGKRNSLPSEEETDGVNHFYDDEIQNATGLRRKVPLSQNSRGFNSLNDRLLKTMVANEIKKVLNGEDNKKLVAHHRPVLHSESDTNEPEMVVVGVVLNSKQAQNEEVFKAIEMLRRNGVSCISFTLKDSLQNGEKKDDNSEPQPSENNGSASTEEVIKSLMSQRDNENTSPSLEQSELSPAPKKVSSPTVSTTSDYASPKPTDALKNDDVVQNLESVLASCTSTTSPALTTATEEGETTVKAFSRLRKRKGGKRNAKKTDAGLPPMLSPNPPVLFPQVSDLEDDNHSESLVAENEETAAITVTIKERSLAEETAMKRKKRRKRMYPFLSRRKSRSKRKKPALLKQSSAEIVKEDTPPSLPAPAQTTLISLNQNSTPNKPTQTREVDPYEFEDSDVDGTLNDILSTPSSRSLSTNSASSRKRRAKIVEPSLSLGSNSKRKSCKRSPRKRLNFSKPRAFSPDITGHSATRRQHEELSDRAAENVTDDACTSLESCVQLISTKTAKNGAVEDIIPEEVKLVLPEGGHDHQCEFVQTRNCDQSPQNGNVNANNSEETNHDRINPLELTCIPVVNKSEVESKSKLASRVDEPETDQDVKEFVVPAPPDDSLHDAPDSMQLRRSSFYSSISRNVRTNMEKYLDGRPPDLKPAKRSKKIKNGFLLHHGDNFPDDPEAPYRLHLATQVLLKLNKRRVKCKPKEDKGKSLLSYLKLQPKRVSRGGKNSKVSTEDSETASSKDTISVFSGEWTVPRKFVCNICGQVENAFWDMVMHKGEVHPGIVVTHVELNNDPPEGFRRPPSPRITTTLLTPPPCTKCGNACSTYSDLHRHIFECAGNATVLEEGIPSKAPTKKKKGKRKRGFKRRIAGVPKKNSNKATLAKSGEITKRRNSEVFKCEFCTREFKTEGWLKNHVSLSHSLPISIPLNKLSLPTRASISSSRRFAAQVAKPSKPPSRES